MSNIQNKSVNVLNSLVRKGENFVYSQKLDEWKEIASKADEEVLTETLEIMKMLEGGISTKKAIKQVEKINNKEAKSQIIFLVTNFSKFGPEFEIDRIQKQYGSIDRTNEYVAGLFQKMDENANYRYLESKEKEQQELLAQERAFTKD